MYIQHSEPGFREFPFISGSEAQIVFSWIISLPIIYFYNSRENVLLVMFN